MTDTAGAEPPSTQQRPQQPRLVVGVGASAGSIQALREFLGGIPPDTGIALVLLQHAGPTAGDLLVSVVERMARLPVLEAADGVGIEPDRVYVAPPDFLLSIEAGRFRLRPPRNPGDRRSSIDAFFRSLAGWAGSRAVGIVLSGNGTDGTLGLEAISNASGMTMAQDPGTAAHQAMPASAVATGAADHVLDPAGLAAELVSYARHWRLAEDGNDPEETRSEIAHRIPEIAQALRDRTGHDFKHYKTSTLTRRILRRMQVLHESEVDGYIHRLVTDQQEAQQLFRELLIGVTAFFRDPESFEALAAKAIAPLLAGRHSAEVRIWVPGCATGEEAYTLAMLVREQLDGLENPPSVQILATDIDERALMVARRGQYPQGIASQVSPERLERFFMKRGRRYQVAKEIRELCLFSVHNLVSDPPFSRMDLISCRNVLIYLGPHLQKKLIPVFHYALRSGGFLFLGSSETVTGHAELFRPVDLRHRISQRKEAGIPGSETLKDFGTARLPPWKAATTPSEPDLAAIAQRIVLDEFAPEYAIVAEDGQVVFLSPGASLYVQPPAGAFSSNIVAMARQGLRVGLRAAFTEALRSRRTVVHDSLSVRSENGLRQIRLTIQPMPELGHGAGLYMMVFQDRGPAVAARRRSERMAGGDADAVIEQLERELLRTREDLERTVQDLEAANEELKSSNEELLSMNEELQSANEELETSKEEVQAANAALAKANSDLENLLRSSRIATIFLDDLGAIRSFTPAASELYNLIPGDVGRPLSHLTHRFLNLLPIPAPAELDAASDAVEHEAQIDDGRWFLRRALRYRTPDGESDGTLITFVDITHLKHVQEALIESEERLLLVLEAGNMGAFDWELKSGATRWNDTEFALIGADPKADRASPDLFLARVHPEDRPAFQERLEAVIAGTGSLDAEFRVMLPDERVRWLATKGRILASQRSQSKHLMGVNYDITPRKQAEERQRLLIGELNHRVKNSLATVQAIIRHTLRTATSPKDFAAAVEGRVQALAAAHSLLTRTNWDGADLAELIAEQTSPHVPEASGGRIATSGPAVSLTAPLAFSLGMILHELATNAAKYGALSRAGGTIDVSWRIVPAEAGRVLHLEWTEAGGPPVRPPERRGFGSTLIERSLRHEARGEARLSYHPDGLRCQIRVELG
ncbi:CheR family methyltransferase [Arenibaculum pallidiluteum]|uniref:CheR family methyltransferase n=1 Tax=Arenibaculum pallidiluteum TaxID=2812559 RepID=UPI001A972836|nr:CheR family methyltransferase [Arenibaculum pallidiluteum]